MNRRSVIALLGGAAAWPLAVRAQSPKLLRVGLVSLNPRTFVTSVTFETRMRELGYVEGQNLTIDFVHLTGRDDRPDQAMQELIGRRVEIIVVGVDMFINVAIRATKIIPIVMIAFNFDPVDSGYVTSIARPTGNVTGLYIRRPELVAKQVEIFSEAFPTRTRLGVLWDSESRDLISAAAAAASLLKLEILPLKLENPPYDFAAAFQSLADNSAEFVFVLSGTLFNEHRSALAQLAIHHRLPTMFISNLYVEAGGLMSYGANTLEMYRRAADYVVRLATGAKPADLPIEQPSKFDLVINARAAKSLGITIPNQLIARADEVIE